MFLLDTLSIYHLSSLSVNDLINGTMILAQRIEDPDILGQIQNAWNNFVETGQIWAMLIGIFFGYMFRSFTSF
jgi:hypothetical protein